MTTPRPVTRLMLALALGPAGALVGCQGAVPGGGPLLAAPAERPAPVGRDAALPAASPAPQAGTGVSPRGRAAPTAPAYAPDRLVVSLKPGQTAARLLARPEASGLRVLRDLDWGAHHVLTLGVPEGASLTAMRARLATLPEVRDAEFDLYAQPHAVPNDPMYGDQWAHAPAFANTQAAWDRLTGVEQSKVIVAIIDSGIDVTHEEFTVGSTGDRLIGGRNVTPKPNSVGGTQQEWEGNLQDNFGHGTITAGIIGATGNNGKGMAGVAWGCRLMPIKADSFVAEGEGAGNTTFVLSDVIAGIKYASDFTEPGGARVRVINMSLGQNIGRVIPIYNDAVAYARKKGILVIASSGNQGAPYVSPPANTPGVLAVGATASYMGVETVAHFSNYGPRLDLVAPGGGIRVTLPAANNSDAGGIGVSPGLKSYGFASGTSESAPYVSGVAALVFAKYDPGNASLADPVQAMAMVDKVRAHLMASVDDLGPPGWDSSWGYGRLNADRALTPAALQPLPPMEGRLPVL